MEDPGNIVWQFAAQIAVVLFSIISTALIGAAAWYFRGINRKLEDHSAQLTAIQVEMRTCITALQGDVRSAIDQVKAATRQLDAMWPLIPGANERTSDKIRRSRNG